MHRMVADDSRWTPGSWSSTALVNRSEAKVEKRPHEMKSEQTVKLLLHGQLIPGG